MSRSRVTTADPLSPAPASEEMNKELVTRISALQELVMNQTSQLEELYRSSAALGGKQAHERANK